MNKGNLYVMFNPSMEGIVKLGMCTKSPDEFAKELSISSGLPTKFYPVYWCELDDCSSVKENLFKTLDERGFRVSEDSDFFRMSIKMAVGCVIINELSKARAKDPEDTVDDENYLEDEINDIETNDIQQPWEDVVYRAELSYYGLDDEIQDYEEAFELYKESIHLGYLPGYRMCGSMYADGDGVGENKKKAIEYLKQGAREGDYNCFAELASIYVEREEIENAFECYNNYFTQSDGFVDYEHLNENQIQQYYAYNYIEFIIGNDLNLEHQDKLKVYKDLLIETGESIIENLGDEFGYDWVRRKRKTIKFIERELS